MQEFKKVLSVSDISYQIRNSLESQFPSVWIKGELSNFIAHSSGHWYFSLKDSSAQIKAVMFKGQNQKLSFLPKTGEELLVRGQISVYPPRGDYQVICQDMEVSGFGQLQRQFEEIKRRLEEEGLFDSDRKKPIPKFPKHIVLITSETGAAVRDILKVLNRRFKAVQVTLIPALVQGNQAPASLLEALHLSKKPSLKADLVIMGRGGGSMEDLWAFNDETLARAVAEHPIPVISAVGHEIDFTICDFVADLRAPTPSASAELAVQDTAELLDQLSRFKKQFLQNISLRLSFFKDKIGTLEKSLIHPSRLIQDTQQRLDELNLRLIQNMRDIFEGSKNQLKNFEQVLQALNPQKVMERGFSIVSDSKGELISSTKDLKIKDKLFIDFFKGQVQAEVTEKIK